MVIKQVSDDKNVILLSLNLCKLVAGFNLLQILLLEIVLQPMITLFDSGDRFFIMVATAATCAFFPVASPPPDSGAKTSSKLGGPPANVDARGIKSKSAATGGLQVKANAQAPSKVNGTKVGVMEGLKSEDDSPSLHQRTFINQLPDWSMLLAAVTTIFLAAEKQWMMLDWKPRRPDMLVDPFGFGKIVEDGFVFRQNFSIRSYEIGADRTASIETLMNHLQETALNHVKSAGLLGDGFGSTPEMCKKNLIWVVTKMQVLVDRYPTWGDVVQVDTWVAASGKNGMRRDWLVRDCRTGDILTRASSVWVMMNKETRRLSKIPNEVRGEIGTFFVDSPPVVDEDSRKLPKLDESTADYIRNGLTPRWSDLDVNQHVNNVKYIGWILESAPLPILESHELCGMTLEYRRECGRDSVLQSLTTVSGGGVGSLVDPGYVECQHLLRLEGGAEIVKGRTEWRPKYANCVGTLGSLPAESISLIVRVTMPISYCTLCLSLSLSAVSEVFVITLPSQIGNSFIFIIFGGNSLLFIIKFLSKCDGKVVLGGHLTVLTSNHYFKIVKKSEMLCSQKNYSENVENLKCMKHI
ncbi:hypothetical protein HYC85_025880 [Camellia sinensis]|uniref:Acyl-[acyl-carrier-protein] hydrolase n=1 Tax=Camellia sinensis TaxID=4442 RepID=A0A7J7G415_CAMSI|nr:hypothetical protein HYC85_025880 [Camellia sinensis]